MLPQTVVGQLFRVPAHRSLASVIVVGVLFPVLDTERDARARVVHRWRAMSPCERLDQVAALNHACEQLAEAGVRRRHPAASEDEVRRRVIALRLGRETMVGVYGWDPMVEGW
jgi:hypothetical protein